MPAAVMAQFWPGYGYSGGYPGWGGYVSDDSTERYVAEADHIAGERAANQQQMALQGSIRNTMAANEVQRQQLYTQQQGKRNWWFQVEQQQLAQQEMQRPAVPSAGFESAATDINNPQAATDIIKWLPVLRDPRFAAERARIKALYRRGSKGLSRPTAGDYRDMIQAAERMKAILKSMTPEITAEEYLDAEAFLNQLAAEAREGIQEAAAAKQK